VDVITSTIDIYGTLVIDSLAAVKTLIVAGVKANNNLNKLYGIQ